MHFKSLKMSHLRNIEELAIEFHPDFNLITGNNGSGKTSLIEALYLLAVGRSFRANGNAALIQHNFDALTLFALLSEQKRIGLEKHKQGQTRLRLDQQAVNSSSEVATLLPVQLIYQDIFSIIDAGPGVRRSLLEWGMFYQNKEYFSYWKKLDDLIPQNFKSGSKYKRTGKAGIFAGSLELVKEGNLTIKQNKLFCNYNEMVIPW